MPVHLYSRKRGGFVRTVVGELIYQVLCMHGYVVQPTPAVEGAASRWNAYRPTYSDIVTALDPVPTNWIPSVHAT